MATGTRAINFPERKQFCLILATTYTGEMDLKIRNVSEDDLPAVLSLNDLAVPHVNRIDIDQMRWFAGNAHYFRVAARASEIDGFLIGMGPGLNYQSLNYQWFCENSSDFAYVDRIVVCETARKSGLGKRFYNDFAAHAPDGAQIMTCEVNIRPPNKGSMQFHFHQGFRQIGSQIIAGGSKEVALLEKAL